MAKVKAILFVILVIVLVDFAFENAQPPPMVRLFKFDLGQPPTFLLTYLSLALGFIIGWLGHVLRVRRKKREAAAAAAASTAAQEQQKSQQAQEGRQTSGYQHPEQTL